MTITNKKITTGQQFFHVELYGKKENRNAAINRNKRQSKRGRPNSKNINRALNDHKRNRLADKASSQRTIKGIINEAERSPGYCDHVIAPQPPVLLYGMELPRLEEKLEKIYASAKTLVVKKGGDLATRKIRTDQKILLAGVASNPRLSVDYISDSSTKKMVDLWLSDCLDFLKKEYGDRLQTAIVHLDENHPHIHFYCLPEVYEATVDGELVPLIRGVDSIHDGKRAEKEVEAQANLLKGKDKIMVKQNAYKAAMEKLQDRYFASVSSYHGHQRLGPGRKRFNNRVEYFDWLNGQQSLENAAFKQRKADLDRFVDRNKLGSEILSKKSELESINAEINQEKKRIPVIKSKVDDFKSMKVKEINEELIKYRYEIKGEIEKSLEDEIREEKLSEIKELSGVIENKHFIFGEVKRVVKLQEEQILCLEKSNNDLRYSERMKGVELAKTRNELASEISLHNDLKKRFSKLERTYDSLVEKFNFLYKHGREFFDKSHGRLKSFIKKVSEITL
ncbi:plasmid recombination protein [Endozoicomonas sp. GU-1]|uniref:plasmid recombination protein n=1 Tax=Endozoicomonas sp. GU-1 TaxID=3009078 RepID=UPI0022B5072F|nr:plasmid recombination protein [Endozoicomonas sp. GU-1]WBA79838.1 plasmid recombination protein [Endozoicomonas sp. GU-1]WBA87413.1 plasmid recombination protein [Endozoicomonas sp. GU-1]